MTAEKPGENALAPIKPARVAQEITKLSTMRRNGELTADNYDQKFARIIQELRDRRIEGGRPEINAALQPLVAQGTITAAEFDRLTKQLGLT
ncbi:MAG: hypothetical protein ABJD11_12405 [Gemmatimonadota bacterium]